MKAIHDLHRTPPNSRERVPSAVVTSCVLALARWLKAQGASANDTATAIDGVSDVIEGSVLAEEGELLIFAITTRGLWALASADDDELTAFIAMAEAEGAPWLSLNPALMDRDAHDLVAKGGRHNAQRHLH